MKILKYKKANMAILMSNKVDLKTKRITKNREGHTT